MLELKLNHVNKRGHRYHNKAGQGFTLLLCSINPFMDERIVSWITNWRYVHLFLSNLRSNNLHQFLKYVLHFQLGILLFAPKINRFFPQIHILEIYSRTHLMTRRNGPRKVCFQIIEKHDAYGDCCLSWWHLCSVLLLSSMPQWWNALLHLNLFHQTKVRDWFNKPIVINIIWENDLSFCGVMLLKQTSTTPSEQH